ncbi:hypothetical protein QBC32DRAFT_338924 [Pseudoneurospora amorphoporcata]|uniref:Uncharacterized protein n=1 Tax=Pseudoneurospora amorphoporcata TaxID=241081 RepID=A0AAN6NYR3_9PEZI|nr:hypothetical protein QBC32DRAFT_338924 [Pseudoneurospora amorphoporcata]
MSLWVDIAWHVLFLSLFTSIIIRLPRSIALDGRGSVRAVYTLADQVIGPVHTRHWVTCGVKVRLPASDGSC